MENGDFYRMIIPWDDVGQEKTHVANWIRTGQPGDNMAETNRREVYQGEQLAGYEAYDYQNPYVFQGNLLLTVATLMPTYGIFSDTPANVARNISMNAGILAK